MIEGVWVVPLEVHCDDRGYLFEIARRTGAPEAYSVIHKFGQVYLVGDVARGTIRAFHKHLEVWDWFCIGHGSAKAVLIDGPGIGQAGRSLKDKLDLPIRLFVALLAGVALAFLWDYLDDTLRDRAEVEALGVALLGEIPRESRRWGKPKGS